MPSRAPLWTRLRTRRCPQCTRRTFSSTCKIQVGPEHPRYIDIPEPPQQTLPYRPFVKGTLPVPRDVFAGAQGKDRAADDEIAKATPLPQRERWTRPGSREEWNIKISEARRRNLREGLKGLRTRKLSEKRRIDESQKRQQMEREELVKRPEREDDRLTTPSHGLDLEKLLHGKLEDPTREARLAYKKILAQQHAEVKQSERLESLHTLYMRARHFIVTPEQLDKAVDEAFGTTEEPVAFGDHSGVFSKTVGNSTASVWAYGKPASVQDMLAKANRQSGKTAMEGADGHGALNRERIRRIAEGLTGGKMEEESL